MTTGISVAGERIDRERAFWDEHVPSLDECLRQYEGGPDPNTRLMLDAVEPLEGSTVLDFACGTGVTSAWLAQRGASVTGVDVSPHAIERARELCRSVGADVRFVVGDIGEEKPDLPVFDCVVGRFALHHVDVVAVSRALAHHLRPGGVGAFLETMDLNPLLRRSRRHLAGRFGVPRCGSLDEHPLTRDDLQILEQAFGPVQREVAEMRFLGIFDRQVLRYRWPSVSRALTGVDRLLLDKLGLVSWSYHQVVVLRRVST